MGGGWWWVGAGMRVVLGGRELFEVQMGGVRGGVSGRCKVGCVSGRVGSGGGSETRAMGVSRGCLRERGRGWGARLAGVSL